MLTARPTISGSLVRQPGRGKWEGLGVTFAEEIIEAVRQVFGQATSINPNGRTVWTMLGNIMCEVAEAWEVVREGTFDPNVHITYETDKYGNAKPEGIGPELADIFIRTMDTAKALGIDLEKMVAIKHQYNLGRKSKHGGKRV